MVPGFVFYVIANGISQRKDIYSLFVKGATDGLKIVIELVPTLIGLMVSVAVLRASGFLDLIGNILGKIFGNFPSELISLFIVKLFSSSASTGVALDIFKKYGTDSFAGMTTSLALSSTETVFYTLSVYFIAAKITKTRWTAPAALLSTFAGIIVSIILAKTLT